MPLDEKLEYEIDKLKADIASEKNAKEKKRMISTLNHTIGKGSNQIRGGSLSYHYGIISRDYDISYDEWQAMSLKWKAFYIAVNQTENTISTYQRMMNSS